MLAAPATRTASFANADDTAEAGRIVAATLTVAILAANGITIASKAPEAPTDATDVTEAEAATISLAADAARAAETAGDAAEATTIAWTRPKRCGTNASTIITTGRAVLTPVATERDRCRTTCT
jgi:hypothetical protein